MVPPMRKRPAGLAPLNLAAFQSGASSPRTPANPGRPTRVILVVSSSSNGASGLLSTKTLHDVPIVGIVASSGPKPPEGAEDVPSALVSGLTSLELPPNAASTAFLLPTLTSPTDASDGLIALLSSPASAGKTIELRLALMDDAAAQTALQDAVEDALSKAYDREIKEGREGGATIVLDLLASPPAPTIESSELVKSEAFRSWSNFISRLSLHPRVLLKLSQPSSPAPSSSEDKSTEASELKRRLRILLDVALEAFGDERLLFGLESPSQSQSGGGSSTEEEDDAAAWYEGVRGAFSDIGLGETEMNRIFADNAARVYGLKI